MRPMSVSREFLVQEPYLNFTVQNAAPKRHVRFAAGGAPVREFEIELAGGAADFWVIADVRPFAGQRLVVALDGQDGDDLRPDAIAAVRPGSWIFGAEDLY